MVKEVQVIGIKFGILTITAMGIILGSYPFITSLLGIGLMLMVDNQKGVGDNGSKTEKV